MQKRNQYNKYLPNLWHTPQLCPPQAPRFLEVADNATQEIHEFISLEQTTLKW